jgi:DNA (cytosine-5)-methyltransferase 1
VLSDKTNAFGSFVSSLAGYENILNISKWPSAGVIHGIKRNVVWRVLDAKYFGVPQNRKRLYVVSTGKNINPEDILLEQSTGLLPPYPQFDLKFIKQGHEFEIFREYTDCLYSAYGTKWNGNAAAYNGSLYIVQNNKLRRFSPLECERLMGLPDDYTNIPQAKKTKRYQAIGNAWAVPVIRWIGERIIDYHDKKLPSHHLNFSKSDIITKFNSKLNVSPQPEKSHFTEMKHIVSVESPEDIYISPVGCYGIIRRKNERNLKINPQLEKILIQISAQSTIEYIENCSKRQKRGKYSKNDDSEMFKQLTLFGF